MPPQRGRPPKKKRNISGLKNQKPAPQIPNQQDNVLSDSSSEVANIDLGKTLGESHHPLGDLENLTSGERKDEDALGCKSIDEQKGPPSRGIVQKSAPSKLSKINDDDEWKPDRRRRTQESTGRPSEYAKGPDVMNKSQRTKRRYAESWKGQTLLDGFLAAGSKGASVLLARRASDHGDSGSSPELA